VALVVLANEVEHLLALQPAQIRLEADKQLFLRQPGYRVITAKDGVVALEKLEEERADVILCDIMMPRMDGFEVIRKLRVNPSHKNSYLILITAKFQESDRVTGLELGADDCLIKPFSLIELLARIRAGSRVVRYKKQIEHEALIDSLTGLPNRRAFEKKLEEEFDRARRYGHPVSVLILDVDDFKRINDTYGHHLGDNVLRKIAENLQTRTRRSDYPARYGGDEFVLILPEDNMKSAYQAADKLRLQIKEFDFRTSTGAFSITVSIGVSSTSEKSYSDCCPLVQEADQALYLAKTNGKDQVQTALSRNYIQVVKR